MKKKKNITVDDLVYWNDGENEEVYFINDFKKYSYDKVKNNVETFNNCFNEYLENNFFINWGAIHEHKNVNYLMIGVELLEKFNKIEKMNNREFNVENFKKYLGKNISKYHLAHGWKYDQNNQEYNNVKLNGFIAAALKMKKELDKKKINCNEIVCEIICDHHNNLVDVLQKITADKRELIETEVNNKQWKNRGKIWEKIGMCDDDFRSYKLDNEIPKKKVVEKER